MPSADVSRLDVPAARVSSAPVSGDAVPAVSVAAVRAVPAVARFVAVSAFAAAAAAECRADGCRRMPFRQRQLFQMLQRFVSYNFV